MNIEKLKPTKRVDKAIFIILHKEGDKLNYKI